MPSRSGFPRTGSDVVPVSDHKPTNGNNLYHPRYWGAWAGIAFLYTVGRFPRVVTLKVGKLFGRLFYLFNKKRRRYALTNLEICFPHWPVEKRRQAVIDHFRVYGQAVVDQGVLWSANERYLKQHVHYSGTDNWYKAVAENRSVIILTPHVVATELTVALLAGSLPICAMMKRFRNPLFNQYIVKGRSRFGLQLFNREEGIRKLIRSLKNGITCCYIPDQDFGGKASIFVPFFGTPASTLTTLGRLARITDAVVLPLFAYLDPETGHYRAEIGSPLPDFPTSDTYADARTMNAIFEEIIQRAPEQYMWTLRWFKTRPNNEPIPY